VLTHLPHAHVRPVVSTLALLPLGLSEHGFSALIPFFFSTFNL
jgi:hypothetical protein